MKARKRILMMAAAVGAMGMLAGCKAPNTGSDQTTAAQTQPAGSDAQTGNSPKEKAAESENSRNKEVQSGRTLVVYYSANGHTERVANAIAGEVGADLFELEPVKPYTSDDLNYTNADSRVSKEHENQDLRDIELVSTTTEDWDSYETVFIGYPIWWGIAAWPVNGFVEANDFTGKTVIPFCTSASSGLGESGELLAEMAGTGDWQEGIRFGSGVSEEEVEAWAAGLGVTR